VLVHWDVDTGYTCHLLLTVPAKGAAGRLLPYNKRRGKNAAFYLKPTKSHTKSALPLLVALVRANDVDDAPAAHDLAVLADLLD
jgi:hypothetical protein